MVLGYFFIKPEIAGQLNLDYALDFVARIQNARISVTLEIEPKHRCGKIEK